MALTLFNDPFMTDMDRTMNRMFNTFGFPGGFGTMAPATRPTTTTTMAPFTGATGGGMINMPMDIIETDQAYELHADCPGLQPDDVKVELHEGVLTVSGNRNIKREEKDPAGKVWRSERTSFSFARSFTLPENASGDNINACMDKGVLKVCIPKTATEAKPEPKRFQVMGPQ